MAAGGTESILRKLTEGIPIGKELAYSCPVCQPPAHQEPVLNGNPISSAPMCWARTSSSSPCAPAAPRCSSAGLTSAFYIPFGTILGLAAGYFRRRTDEIITYLYSVIASVPTILLLIAIISAFDKSFLTITGASWPSPPQGRRVPAGSRRNHASNLGSQHIAAARSLGQSHWKILTRPSAAERDAPQPHQFHPRLPRSASCSLR